MPYRDYAKDVKKVLAQKKIPCIGCFHCRGWNTYGVFGKIGGIAKNRPNDKDLKNAQEFALKIVQK
jgi:flavodoxin